MHDADIERSVLDKARRGRVQPRFARGNQLQLLRVDAVCVGRLGLATPVMTHRFLLRSCG
ncbi:hypothetical protein XAP412_90002 [Xanthomonas phaseoli pv. phaseoli]|uniref:Transposase n=1 Tax=Xanthomonas campestris pv. phaseoli TaxID=317013 RepID=A0AB38DVJ4_XANCH|nr:hypothetical protein XAP7430_100043 [Xanthomonas phaseoli pv. phaseoli]SON77743.1 hypothetical protein XAP6984_140002 [Xanthomonas phaseoli pv. phaseoli]SON91456.1 hypothetical protein XAP412_90002 [Xanthomonas phaseoli pv. phaseoli]SOO27707.1 hypothetical protein XAP6164_180001 [Xanthomonas phaseoli pv. phaseoli]